MRGSLSMDRRKELENLKGRMALVMRVTGSMDRGMERENR